MTCASCEIDGALQHGIGGSGGLLRRSGPRSDRQATPCRTTGEDAGLSRLDRYLWLLGDLAGAPCLFGDIRGQAAMDCYLYCVSNGYGFGHCEVFDAECHCQVCWCHSPGSGLPDIVTV